MDADARSSEWQIKGRQNDSRENLRGFRRGEPTQHPPTQTYCGPLNRTRRPGADFTVEDLWQELRQVEPAIGRATVYRAVEKLVNMGLLARIEFADGTHHYRVCGGNEHHHHLTCTQCHRVVDIDICLPAAQFTSIGNQADFVIEGHSLTLLAAVKTVGCKSVKNTWIPYIVRAWPVSARKT